MIGKYSINIPLLTTHNITHDVWFLDLWNGGEHLYHQATPLVVIICYIIFYLSNTSFQILQKHNFWKFISYWDFVQMKWFEFIFNKKSIIYIITFISFWKFKIIWTKNNWISLFNNISMTILLKKKKFNKWIIFLLI